MQYTAEPSAYLVSTAQGNKHLASSQVYSSFIKL